VDDQDPLARTRLQLDPVVGDFEPALRLHDQFVHRPLDDRAIVDVARLNAEVAPESLREIGGQPCELDVVDPPFVHP
jgi:hypothetical protein